MKIKERERERGKNQDPNIVSYPVLSFFCRAIVLLEREGDGGSTGSSSLLGEKEAKKGKKEGGKERKNERRDH